MPTRGGSWERGMLQATGMTLATPCQRVVTSTTGAPASRRRASNLAQVAAHEPSLAER